jgi:hypothetical protein
MGKAAVAPSRSSASPVAIPMRTGNSHARGAAKASAADLVDAKAPHTPSLLCLNTKPRCVARYLFAAI